MNDLDIHLEPVIYSDKNAVGEFCAIVNKYIYHAYPIVPQDVDQTTQFYWAMQGNVRVGTSGYTLRTPTLCEIRKTMILPEFRRKGMGERLCLEMETECKSLGIKKVYVTVFSTNLPMLFLRMKMGYRVEGYHPDHEAPGFHEYSLGKSL